MSAVLSCKGVQMRFGSLMAAKGVDLTVMAGEIVGVIGSNGAGKTTLLNIVSGYLRPTAGRVIYLDEDVTGMPPRKLVRRGIGRSFQVPQLFTRSTVLQNMMLALALLVEPRAAILRSFVGARLRDQARSVLAEYGLEQFADTSVNQVPQGARKLLDIAMAMSAAPVLVLLDEPTSGVSTEEKHGLMRQLAGRFAKSATTVVFIEHDMDVVFTYATRVVALCDGEVIADGSARTVFRDDVVRRLISGAFAPPEDGRDVAGG